MPRPLTAPAANPAILRGILALLADDPRALRGFVSPKDRFVYRAAGDALSGLRRAPADHYDALFYWLHVNEDRPLMPRVSLEDAATQTGVDYADLWLTVNDLLDLLNLGCDLTPVLDPDHAPLVAHVAPARLAAALAAGLNTAEIAAGFDDTTVATLLALRGLRTTPDPYRARGPR